MRGLQLVPHNLNWPFVATRRIIYIFSIAVMALCAWSFYSKGFNFGIDFKGGFLIEIRTDGPADVAKMRTDLDNLGLGEVKLQQAGSDRDVMIRVERQPGDEKNQTIALNKIKATLGDKVDYRRVETVGAKVSQDLVENGIWALAFALVGMLLYIWFRFEWHFGVCGIVALAHDAVAVLGFYSLFQHEFNETAFIALLTTIGFSINDSVVIYDRIRENLRKYKKMGQAELINKSINETLSRTVLTVLTVSISLVALVYYGGPVISSFCLPILVGILFGTYSSIFVSANLLMFFDIRKKMKDEDAVKAPEPQRPQIRGNN